MTPARCRGCGRENDAHDEYRGEPSVPERGDVSICGYCLTIGIFTEDGTTRAPTDMELAGFHLSPVFQQGYMAALGWNRRHAT